MKLSVLVSFDARLPDNPESRTFNAEYLAERLTEHLLAVDITVLLNELWKDFGWYVSCRVGETEFDLFLAYEPDAQWELTIEPAGQPGVMERLMGHKPKPFVDQLKRLTLAVSDFLHASAFIDSIEFCLSNDVKNGVESAEALSW